MPKHFSTLIGKSVRAVAQLRGGGSALPGLVVETIDKDFVREKLSQLPLGVVVISGTNGKTTTTKMVVELLESQGLRVFTNRTGSNFTRGVAAALLADVDLRGRLHADIAVLELDEAHGTHFVKSVLPRYALLLNVMRDQLDRFGEIDTTARLLQTIASTVTHTLVLNREDNRIRAIKPSKKTAVSYFGINSTLASQFPNDDALYDTTKKSTKHTPADVTLEKINTDTASFKIHNKTYTTSLKLSGIYNTYNAAGALALVQCILPDADPNTLIQALSSIEPAFGRGETIMIDGRPVELVLVKNPSGFRLGLSSFTQDSYSTMIAINDNYADGRDMSWLWDVDFSVLARGVTVVGGIRAYDMALRLKYDEIPVVHIEPDLKKALNAFLDVHGNKRIYCTYTAMLTIRKLLAKYGTVEKIS